MTAEALPLCVSAGFSHPGCFHRYASYCETPMWQALA